MHISDLEPKLPPKFRGHLSTAEKRLVKAATSGDVAYCSPSGSEDARDAANDPANADEWGSEREIRADLIRWLCLGEDLAKEVDPHGLQIYAAKIVDEVDVDNLISRGLDLSFANVPFPLTFYRCSFDSDADFDYLRIPALYLDGSSTHSISLEGAEVKGDLRLREHVSPIDGGAPRKAFSAVGRLWLLGARIGGSLDCTGGKFRNPGREPDDYTLVADRAEIRGSVFSLKIFPLRGRCGCSEPRLGAFCTAKEEPSTT